MCEEDKSISEEDNPFHKDSFIGLESVQCNTVESSVNSSESFNDPFSSKTESVDKMFGPCDHTSDNSVEEEENPFCKDSFVLLQEQLTITKELTSSTTDHKIDPLSNIMLRELSFHDPFLQSDPFSSKAATSSGEKDTVPEEEP